MSARVLRPHHPESAHACVATAIRRLVYRIGLNETARLLHMSASQMSRRCAEGHCAAWRVEDMMALKKRERDEFGTRELHDAEERAIYGEEPGESVAASDHVVRGIGLHGEIVALEAKILAGGINEDDRLDVFTLQAKIDHAHEADRQAMASLRAKLGPQPGRVRRA